MPDLPPAPSHESTIEPAALVTPRWSAVLAAGDVTLHTGDDAVLELDHRLQEAGIAFDRIHILSADKELFMSGFETQRRTRGSDKPDEPARSGVDEAVQPTPRRLPGGTEPARPAVLLRDLLDLDGRHGGACLAYLAASGDGKTVELLEGDLSPEQLDRALDAGCGNAPTVVVVSGCGTGAFAAPPMTRSNRLILTAATGDRHGFGCGPNRGLTTFDECLIGALPGSETWTALFDRTRYCVKRRESLVAQPSVDPQVFVGAAVATLTTPWHSVSKTKITFRQGIGRFTLDGVPYFSTLKAKTRAMVEAYAHAALPKALALTLSGTVAMAQSTSGETPDDIDRLALQRCEWQSGGACMLYARNENLAAAGASGMPDIQAPLLVRQGALDPATTPFIRTDQRVQIEAYRRLPSPKALALGPDDESISIGTGATPEAARAAALAQCRGTGCVLYADGDRIVLGSP
jgi:hypothetical protein